jgi:drug/metabolite transporter (DMT)-like permease
LILTEKLVSSRQRVSRAIGLAFIFIGVIVVARPEFLTRLSSQVTLPRGN